MSHSAKLTGISQHRQEGGFQDAVKQVISFRYPVLEFRERHDQGVYFTSENLLGFGGAPNDIFEAYVAYDEEIDVTVCGRSSAGN